MVVLIGVNDVSIPKQESAPFLPGEYRKEAQLEKGLETAKIGNPA